MGDEIWNYHINDLQRELERLQVERDQWVNQAKINERKYNRLHRAVQDIENAILEEGKMPPYHKRVMERHREEWGTLHTAIDRAREIIHEH